MAIDIWVIIDIRNDKEFPASFCEGRGSSCCASCVWCVYILIIIEATANIFMQGFWNPICVTDINDRIVVKGLPMLVSIQD